MIACPVCRMEVPPTSVESSGGSILCRGCGNELFVQVFPSMFRPPPVSESAGTPVLPEQSTCFFHEERPAGVVCAHCGRFLCTLCDVLFEGQHVCPTCIGSGIKKRRFQHLDRTRLRYDRFALVLAALPLLMWPFTLVTAPAALGVVLFGWRQPPSLVCRSRWRFLVAAVLAIAQIVGWTFLFVSMAGGGHR